MKEDGGSGSQTFKRIRREFKSRERISKKTQRFQMFMKMVIQVSDVGNVRKVCMRCCRETRHMRTEKLPVNFFFIELDRYISKDSSDGVVRMET